MKLSKENNVTAVTEFFLLGFQCSHLSRMFLFCLFLVVYFLTICGNLLIITLVSTTKDLHTPMYFFIALLSISDILLPTDIVPNLLHLLLNNGGAITLSNCFIQLYVFGALEASECYLLTLMSYDRYVAICNPLHYTIIMNIGHCVNMAITAWFVGFLCAFIDTLTALVLMFCGPNIIDHFFCDLAPLMEIACSGTFTMKLSAFVMSFPVLFIPITIIIISYVNIIVTILRCQSLVSRQKVFSTCFSHLTVVCIFYFSLLSVYAFPSGGQTLNLSKLQSLLYTVFTPLINPIIYSLRNKEIKKALQALIKIKHIYH